MKKLGIWMAAALFAVGTINVNASIDDDPEVKQDSKRPKVSLGVITHNKLTQNKVTRGANDGVNRVSRGIEQGLYDLTHNKVTKKIDINDGNQR